MKIYNIRVWLMEKVEKVMDPHFLRNLFSYRKMWGAFSIYSHKRRSDGKPNISCDYRDFNQPLDSEVPVNCTA